MDTHTAVAWAVMEDFEAQVDNGWANVVLSTASGLNYNFTQKYLLQYLH